tara:strand:- start:2449 stop:3207 length:759 start_codon:yes stop_codon:yes gene_type:complete
MPDPYGNPLPGERSGGSYNTGGMGNQGGQGNYRNQNSFLRTASANASNPNMDYNQYLTGLGFDVNDDKVGKYFSGIQDDYNQESGMVRSGFSEGISGLRNQSNQQAMQLGGGQGLSSASNQGFGKSSYGLNQGIQNLNQQYNQGMQSGLLDYTTGMQGAQQSAQSEQRSIAMGLIGQDAKGISYGKNNNNNNNNNNDYPTPPAGLPEWQPPFSPGNEERYSFGGEQWIWDGGSWVTEAQYEDDYNSQYDQYD